MGFMANEAVLKIETHIPINFTVSSDSAFEKGAIVKMISPMTAVNCDSLNQIVAGIVQSEKTAANTTMTSVAVYRGGIFRVSCCGSISDGDPVTTATTRNHVVKATTNDENILGIMFEDATEGQTKLMELRPTTMQLA